MNSKNGVMVVEGSGRFERSACLPTVRSNPASPMVLQTLLESMVKLNEKCDLALRSNHPVVVQEAPPPVVVKTGPLFGRLKFPGPGSKLIPYLLAQVVQVLDLVEDLPELAARRRGDEARGEDPIG